MRKLLLITILSLNIFMVLPAVETVQAASTLDSLTAAGVRARFTADQLTADPRSIAINIINAALTLFGIAFVGLIIYGGWLWMTAAGNQEHVDKAKKVLQWATIGIVIVILSVSISFFIKDSLIKATEGTATSATP